MIAGQTNIKVGLVDDHAIFRDGLANLLNEFPDITVIFKCRNGIELKKEIEMAGRPDVVLMDINMPGMDGHEATVWLKKEYPEIHIMAVSMFEDDMNIIKMLKNGAGGYILKESNANEVARGIRTIKEQGYFMNEIISGRLIHSIQEGNQTGKENQIRITTKELEFLRHCCSELTYKEIADQMRVSPRTVDNYREDLFRKLQLRSRTGLVLYSIKKGIFDIT